MRSYKDRKDKSESMNTLKISHKHIHLLLFIAKVLILSQYMKTLKDQGMEGTKNLILYADYGNLIIFVFFQLYATMAAIAQIDVYCFYLATFVVLYKIVLSVAEIFSINENQDHPLLVYVYTITFLFAIEACFCLFMIYKNRTQIQYHLFKRYGANLEIQKAIQIRQLLRVMVYINFCNQFSILTTQYIVYTGNVRFSLPFYITYTLVNLILNAFICVCFNDEYVLQRKITIAISALVITYGTVFKILVAALDVFASANEP